MELAGRVAWVTGAGSGIGQAVAIALAEAGCHVALTGRGLDALQATEASIRAKGGRALVAAADVTDRARLEGAHRAVLAAFGPADILVNNAGWNLPLRHWRHLTPEAAGLLVATNLTAPVLATLLVLPAMRERREGLLIHIASIAATGVHVVSGPIYSAAKHGARAMSAALNAEEGIHGIRSVCINPGEVATPLLDRRPTPPSAEEREHMVQPEDIADCVLFAARLPARACITDLTIAPTDNPLHRADAHAIVARANAARD